jgi:hypothetical protein
MFATQLVEISVAFELSDGGLVGTADASEAGAEEILAEAWADTVSIAAEVAAAVGETTATSATDGLALAVGSAVCRQEQALEMRDAGNWEA